jgi:hypothetical protein
MAKTRFNMHMDTDLKDWLQEEAKRSGLKTATNYVQLLLEAARDNRILVFPAHAPGVSQAFPGSCSLVGYSPENPASVTE